MSLRELPIKAFLYLAGAAGLALLIWLVIDAGAADVGAALVSVGWGLLAITAWRVVPMTLGTLSWRDMLPPPADPEDSRRRPGFGKLFAARWVRESVNNLLPVGQVGGELVSARLINQLGMPGATALGSVVVDLTVGLITQMVFLLIGLGILVSISTEPAVLTVVWSLLAGMGLFFAILIVFLLAQQRGMMKFGAKVAGGLLSSARAGSLAARASEVDAAIRRIYRRPQIWRAASWRMLCWIAGSGEIWLTMYFLGKPISFGEAMVLESFGAAVRSAAFLIPGAVGVQEGAYIVFGNLFGFSAADSLVISLAKRVRELSLGIPGILAWQAMEGRHLLRRRQANG